jgi:DNA-binding transcriptional MerR regulator/effector-binding domain-containing protein
MKEFLTIQEFSRLSDIAISTLRFWDDIGLFSPLKRNPENNYRYYTLDQIIAVKFITVLSDLKLPLKKIGDTKHTRDPESMVRLIGQQEKQLQIEMRELRIRYSIMFTRREMILHAMSVDENEVSVIHFDDMEYTIGPRNEYKVSKDPIEAFAHYCRVVDEHRINLSLPIGGLHDDMERFMANPGSPDYFFSIDPTGNLKRPEGDYLVAYARGFYGVLGDAHERMAAYADAHSLTLTGLVYTTYLLDEVCISDPKQYLAELSVAVSKPNGKAKPKTKAKAKGKASPEA